MSYSYFSRNGEVLTLEAAVVPLSNIAYSYGFGVYETIRLSKGILYFADQHLRRLMHSAEIISLAHNFLPQDIAQNIHQLIKKNDVQTCNLKILLIGAPAAADAALNILCLNPLYPDRKLYSEGATAITYPYEREYPHAKSLNMLSSYLAYQKARAAGSYDALLVNRAGSIIEGTRTNFLALKDRTLYSPPESEILPGVTRAAVLTVAKQHDFQVIHQDIPLSSLNDYDGAFVTSTSSKIMPLCSIDNHDFGAPSNNLLELMRGYDEYLRDYANSVMGV